MYDAVCREPPRHTFRYVKAPFTLRTDTFMVVAPVYTSVARVVHSEAMRERKQVREHRASKQGKHDLRARTPDGDVIHVCRYQSRREAREARERLKDTDEETRKLIGLPEEYSLTVHAA